MQFQDSDVDNAHFSEHSGLMEIDRKIFCFVLIQSLSHVQLFATPWTVAHQAPLSMGFLRQEYWSGLPLPSPGDLPDTGIEPASPILAGGFFTA